MGVYVPLAVPVEAVPGPRALHGSRRFRAARRPVGVVLAEWHFRNRKREHLSDMRGGGCRLSDAVAQAPRHLVPLTREKILVRAELEGEGCVPPPPGGGARIE